MIKNYFLGQIVCKTLRYKELWIEHSVSWLPPWSLPFHSPPYPSLSLLYSRDPRLLLWGSPSSLAGEIEAHWVEWSMSGFRKWELVQKIILIIVKEILFRLLYTYPCSHWYIISTFNQKCIAYPLFQVYFLMINKSN